MGELTFTNQNPSAPWNNTLNANNGVIGSGTIQVNGDISVLGVTANAGGNSIAANLDLGGGTQVVRCGLTSLVGLHTALMFTGPIHNGSLVKTIGVTSAGTFGSVDGIGLYANNTYTGPTVLNSGSSIAAGVNASSAIKVTGLVAGFAGSSFALVGANGSFPNAMTIEASAGTTFILDNNGSLGANGLIQPAVPQAQNNNRINDNATLVLRDGNFTYRGLAGAAATETFGNLTAVGGHNIVTITPNGGGSVILTGSGNLTVASRATLQVSATGTGNTLGGNAQLKFQGTVPPADATGILRRIVSTSDFLTYSGTTGLTPFTAYASDFSTPGANVSLAAAATAPTQTINALKRSASLTLTIGAADSLTVSSGMLLQATGTGTITGGTLNFGSSPGVLFGTNVISSAITGSDGLIAASGTGTLSGNLSGLSGELTVHGATMNLNTNTFSGPIRVRSGTLNLNVSQTGSGLGAITLGVPENDVDLIGTVPTLAFSGAGANAVFDRDLIVDNAAETAMGLPLTFSIVSRLSPLSNTSGSQTFNGNIELRSSVNLQGGGGGGTGATVFNGNVTGAGRFIIPNGRALFNGTVSNGGGFLISNSGFTAQVSFLGVGSGNGPVVINGGNNTTVSYVNGGLPGGPITLQNASASTAPAIIPLNNSTLNNTINVNSFAIANVGTGIVANWSGPVHGSGQLTKSGPGQLNLTSHASTYDGPVTVNEGTLTVPRRVNAGLTTIAAGATLGISPGGPVGDPSATSVFNEANFVLTGGSAPTGRLDVHKNGVVFDYISSSPSATVRAQIVSGYAGGNWTGNGITSSAAAADPTGHAVGYAEASEVGSPSSFLGQSVDATAVLVRYTRVGDADLNGTTDLVDFGRLAINFNNAGQWVTGDFNFDGNTNLNDFSLLALNFNQSALGSLPRGTAVPEAGVGLMGLIGTAVLARRRRG